MSRVPSGVAGLTIVHGDALGALGTYDLVATIDLAGGDAAGR